MHHGVSQPSVNEWEECGWASFYGPRCGALPSLPPAARLTRYTFPHGRHRSFLDRRRKISN
jgi:hypothetical protein